MRRHITHTFTFTFRECINRVSTRMVTIYHCVVESRARNAKSRATFFIPSNYTIKVQQLVAEGMRDLEEQLVFLRGAIKQRPEDIKVNAGDRMWSR